MSNGAAFNLSDLLLSALVLDDLSPIYRAHAFAMVSKPTTGAELSAENRRADMGDNFLTTYTGKQLLCLQCHNAEWSTTNWTSHWSRTYSPPGKFEKGVFGNSWGRSPAQVYNMFRTDVASGSTDPWGWAWASCGSFRTPAELGALPRSMAQPTSESSGADASERRRV